ncbi:rod shape-determining protein MreC [Tamilnaduibacter salinus]|uniref:Cell shape-determining protein MreC n=1 Tax=Tamilnaduibacter salinus TaxID=1484056 RepID=A0A2U1CUL6_9GAMM|nr:rod shape-determining protein MreC [Tamilnaduibacter salinus]PVY70747.1 rod shape-determining protein MreC [Tamilnaduibacter salinus]
MTVSAALLFQTEGNAIKTIFAQGPWPGMRLMAVALLSLVLMVADARFQRVDDVRSVLGTMLSPIVWLGHLPEAVGEWSDNAFSSREELLAEIDSLRARLLVLERRSSKYATLAADNRALRHLESAASELDESVLVADVIGVTPDPFSHELIINKGARDNVGEGQAIIDADGLMGQVIEVNQLTSRVLLVSDSSHGVPVKVLRSGVRAVLLGTGRKDTLQLMHVPDTADIREGDLLVSSGLGGRFPRGYPVARVASIESRPGAAFSEIEAEPAAGLNTSDLVLVLFQNESPAPPPTTPGDEATKAGGMEQEAEG